MLNKFANWASLLLMLTLVGCASVEPLPPPDIIDSIEEPEIEQVLTEALQQQYRQGLQLLQQQAYPRALRHWQGLAEAYPDYPGVWVNLAISQYHQQQQQDSWQSIKRAEALDPAFCPVHAVKGLLARKQGQFQQALNSYHKALDCNPTDWLSHKNVAILYDLYQQDLTKALHHYRIVQAQQPDQDEQLAMWISDLERRHAQTLVSEGK